MYNNYYNNNLKNKEQEQENFLPGVVKKYNMLVYIIIFMLVILFLFMIGNFYLVRKYSKLLK